MKSVVVIQRSIAQYRVDFWNQLKRKLEDNDVELTLLYGKFNNEDALKNDEVDLEWATFVPNKNLKLGRIELNWQACLPYLKNKDMVIVEQANRNLINYILNFKRLYSKQKVAFWGHGRNMRIDETDIRNRFKSMFINQSDWWFAYTENVKARLVLNGFNPHQITCVENAIDTNSLMKHYQDLSPDDCKKVKESLNINSENIAIYCGSIYKEKRIDFFIEACDKIRNRISDFHAIVIGSGADQNLIEEAIKTRSWMHYLGNKFDLERVKYFKISSVLLMPGLVGLGILDAFALQTPLVTTEYPYHSPEIEYLKNGENGVIVDGDVEEFADNVVSLMLDAEKREKLINGCQISAQRYTVENMVNNFALGIFNCLQVSSKASS